jgi:hypothetical protein
MSHLRIPAFALMMLVIASLACTPVSTSPTATPAPTAQPAATATLAPKATSAPAASPTVAATAKPAATSTRAATARPTTAAQPSGVLFSDDFGSQAASEDKGWVFDTGENVDTTWAANKFIISIKKNNWLGLNWPDGTYDNFGVEAEAQATGGSYAEYGLIFRVGGVQDSRTYYIFGVNTDGEYYLQKKVDGKWADTDPVPATASAYIKPKAKNTLGVLAQGNKLSLYINGFLVKTVTDDSSSKGMVGVYAGTGDNDSAQATFSRLTILTAEKAKADWGTPPAATGPQPTATATKTNTGTGPGTIAVVNSFPGACQANLFGQQVAVIRAEGHSTASKVLPPGRYGVHLAVDIGEVDLELFTLPPGGYCQLTCDAATKSVYNSCR